MSIGLKKGTVKLEPHSLEWDTAAQNVIIKLKEILKGDIVDAQHIGSTSIKNMWAKPIIDIVVGVESFDKIFGYNDVLSANGIVYRRQDHPGQHIYICGDLNNDIHTHYIHVVIWGQKAWNDYLNMRDYLNANDDKAAEYSKLKKDLAEKFSDNRVAYTDAKSSLVEKLLKEASMWKAQT